MPLEAKAACIFPKISPNLFDVLSLAGAAARESSSVRADMRHHDLSEKSFLMPFPPYPFLLRNGWCRVFPFASLLLILLASGVARGASYYFDVNGVAAGSGIVAGNSYTATEAVWTTTTAGTGSSVILPIRQGIFFSAGVDAYGLTYTVAGSVGQISQGITVQEGHVSLTGGGVFFADQTVRTLGEATSLTIAGTAWDFYSRTVTFDAAAGAPITLNQISTLSGRGGNLTKNGSGLLTIAGAASAAGINTRVNNGELRIQHANALYSTSYPAPGKTYTVTVNAGGTLSMAGGLTVVNNTATLSGEGFNGQGALLSAAGANSWNRLLTLAGDTRIAAATEASLTLNPSTGDAVAGAFDLTLGGSGTITITKPLIGITGLTKDDTGTAVLAATNVFTGPTIISSGVLRLIETGNVLATLGNTVTVDAGTLEVQNAASQIWNRPLSGGCSGRFVKKGVGALDFGGTHSFAGMILVEDGTLRLLADATFTGPVRLETAAGKVLDVASVAGGFLLGADRSLTGLGSVNGGVTIAAGATLAPGSGATRGTLAFGNPLHFAGGATLHFDLGPTSASGADLVTVSGNVTFNGVNTVAIPQAALANGTYPLLRSTGGTIGGNVAGLQLTGFVQGTQLAVLQLNAQATELRLVVSANPYVARSLVWAGDGAANQWDAGVTTPWRVGTSPTAFNATDAVSFTSAGAANGVVTLAGLLTPGSVAVNATADYTWTGAGTIQGPAALSKSGTGRLVIAAVNTFSGGTTISGGSVELRTATALGSGAVTNNASLVLAPATPAEFANGINGSGAIIQSSGISTLRGANGFTGALSVAGGTLAIGHVSALGATSGSTSVAAAATLDLNGHAVGAEPVTLSGGTLLSSAASSLSGPVTVTATSVVQTDAAMTLSGALGGSAALTKTGDAPLTLAGSNSTRTGLLTVSAGTLNIIGHSGAGAVTVQSGATLKGSGTLGGALTLAGTLAPSSAPAAPSVLSVGGNAVLQSTATTGLRITKANGLAVNDRLTVAGTLTMGGNLVVSVEGQPLAAGESFTLLSAGSRNGSFASVQLPYLSADLIWDQSALASAGIVRVISLPAVSTRAQRRDWVFTRVAENPDRVSDFIAAGALIARGDIALGRYYALLGSRSLLAAHRTDQEQTHLFETWPGIDLVIRYGQHLDQETKDNIREVVLTFREYSDTTTSNLKTLGHVVRFLGSELYGEDAFNAAREADGITPVSNDWRGSDPNARNSLLAHMNTFAVNGAGEIASRPYFWKNALPLMSLAQLAQDATIKQRAALTYEACLAQSAGYWLRGHLGMPTTRSYPDLLQQHPNTGASMGMFWFHFGGELPPLDSDACTMTAMMNPSVSPILEEAAATRTAPFFSRSRNGSNYLQAWVEQDYILFADGPVGPNSGQVYPNGIVWTETNGARYSHLWVTKPIQDDADLYVSATHGKESREFKETVARDALLYIFDIKPPAIDEPSPTPYAMGYVPGGYRAMVNEAASSGQIFLHYGTVMVAIRSEIPFGWDPASGIAFPSATPKTGDSEFIIDGDTSTARPPATLATPLTSNFRLTVAIETARPADFGAGTAADQLAAFRTAIVAIPKPVRTASATPTASYTTRLGDRLLLAFSSDIDTYPVRVNDAPVDYSLFPKIENPWALQPAASTQLVLRSANRREVLDFTTWTRTITTGPTDRTPPVLSGVPGNITLTPDHPMPVPVFPISAVDDVDGPISVTLTPPAGSIYAPGSFTYVTAVATDASLNTTSATFTVTMLPFVPPPAPAAPWSLANIGNQPATPGNANHNPATGLLIVSGTGGTAGTGASGDIWSGTSEGFTYISQPWIGDGVFTARVASFAATDNGAKAGIMIRETLSAGAKNSFIYLSKSGGVTFQNKTSTNGNASTSTTNGRNLPEWVRLVRSGNSFTAYYSADGLSWTQQGSATTVTMGGGAITVGLAVAPRTGGTVADVTFDNITIHTPQQAWRWDHFDTIADNGIASDGADPDRDGFQNLIEYACAMNPHTGNITPFSMARNGGNLEFIYTKNKAATDVLYTVEWSDTLAVSSWSSTGITSTVQSDSGTTQQIKATLSAGTSGRRFVRLRVTKQ